MASKQETNQCILCYEDRVIFGIGKCNHPICFLCHIKMREKLKNKQCPICKEELDELIMTKTNNTFQSYDPDDLKKYEQGIYYDDNTILKELQSLRLLKCWLGDCLHNDQSFASISLLKKHLKEKHQRYLCDICLEHKTAVLHEQQYYTFGELQKHLKEGDMDEDNNIIFYHPFCEFCNKNFYNEEQFLCHMNQDHFSCYLCQPENKYTFYKNYESLKKHFYINHFVCSECSTDNCVVFKTGNELELHMATVHTNMYDNKLGKYQQKLLSNFNVQTISGFHYEQEKKATHQYSKAKVKDLEGKNIQNQLLSQKVTVLKALESIDQQQDGKLDFRDFFKQVDDQENQEKIDYYQRQLKELESQQHQKHQKNKKKNEKLI